MKPMPYILAVDGGGTGCRALLADRNGAGMGRGTSVINRWRKNLL